MPSQQRPQSTYNHPQELASSAYDTVIDPEYANQPPPSQYASSQTPSDYPSSNVPYPALTQSQSQSQPHPISNYPPPQLLPGQPRPTSQQGYNPYAAPEPSQPAPSAPLAPSSPPPSIPSGSINAGHPSGPAPYPVLNTGPPTGGVAAAAGLYQGYAPPTSHGPGLGHNADYYRHGQPSQGNGAVGPAGEMFLPREGPTM